jgi:hypothetical protein
MRHSMILSLSALLLCSSAHSMGADDLPPLLPESEEISAALEAAPPHLRSDAGVFVLGDTGYRRVRDSRNGFNCLIERDIAAAFEPRCFDAEGSATLIPVALFRAEQRARGVPAARIAFEVRERYARGEFTPPHRVGICYMLSARNLVVDDQAADKVVRVGPRLMFYAPNLSSADFGTTADLSSRFLIGDEATQSAMIIVPVVSARRTRVNYLYPDDPAPLTQSPATVSNDTTPRNSLRRGAKGACTQHGSAGCALAEPVKVERPQLERD